MEKSVDLCKVTIKNRHFNRLIIIWEESDKRFKNWNLKSD